MVWLKAHKEHTLVFFSDFLFSNPMGLYAMQILKNAEMF
jgi:hypothetical protein